MLKNQFGSHTAKTKFKINLYPDPVSPETSDSIQRKTPYETYPSSKTTKVRPGRNKIVVVSGQLKSTPPHKILCPTSYSPRRSIL